jgi:hypothetical protein
VARDTKEQAEARPRADTAKADLVKADLVKADLAKAEMAKQEMAKQEIDQPPSRERARSWTSERA